MTLQNKDFFLFLLSSWGTHLRNFFHLSNLLQMPNSIEWSMLSSWATSRVAMRISFDDCSQFSSVTSVVSDSLWPHRLQHTMPSCPSWTPRVYPNSCPLSRWCHPTISSSVVPFSSCPQSFPASGYFQMSQLFVSGGWSIGVSAPTSVLRVNTQDWFPLGWTS